MPQEYIHQEAIKVAIEGEKTLMCFYRNAADMVTDAKSRKVFAQLAEDKKEHVRLFFKIYRGEEFGAFEEFIKTPCPEEKEVIKELGGIVESQIKESRAWEVAMNKEEQFEKLLRSKARQIVDPGGRAVFDRMAAESRDHLEIMEAEYSRLMRMPDDSEMNTYVRE